MRLIKAHGAGNDFLLLDGRKINNKLDRETIQRLCDRHLGIGADGLIVVSSSEVADFRMIYYNADGSQAAMCGNGARCAVAFAQFANYFEGERCKFEADDGLHEASIIQKHFPFYQIEVEIFIHSTIEKIDSDKWLLDTGVPHLILKVKNVSEVDIIEVARKYRFREDLAPGGVNVDFVDVQSDALRIRTYERGVEDETLSCGTGVSAAGWLAHDLGWFNSEKIKILARGGEFEVTCFKDKILLKGPVEMVGSVELYNMLKQ